MSVEQLNELKQQLSTLTAAEKRDLAALLTAQARKDQVAEGANGAASAQTNGEAPPPQDPHKPDPFRELEMRWLREHREEYAGQYVALWRDQLVAHGTDWRSVLAEARAVGVARPLMARVEALDELPFGGW